MVDRVCIGAYNTGMTAVEEAGYIGLPKAAIALGITRAGLHKRVLNKTVKATRFGRDWFIPRDEVARLMGEKALTVFLNGVPGDSKGDITPSD